MHNDTSKDTLAKIALSQCRIARIFNSSNDSMQSNALVSPMHCNVLIIDAFSIAPTGLQQSCYCNCKIHHNRTDQCNAGRCNAMRAHIAIQSTSSNVILRQSVDTCESLTFQKLTFLRAFSILITRE